MNANLSRKVLALFRRKHFFHGAAGGRRVQTFEHGRHGLFEVLLLAARRTNACAAAYQLAELSLLLVILRNSAFVRELPSFQIVE